MKTDRHGRKRLRKMLENMGKKAKALSPQQNALIQALSMLLDDVDEYARVKHGIKEHITWLHNQEGWHPSPGEFYERAQALDALLKEVGGGQRSH